MFSANPSNGWLVVMKATRHLFEGSKLRGMDLGPNLRALIRILRPFNGHLVYGDEAAISECSGESALLVCSFVPLGHPPPCVLCRCPGTFQFGPSSSRNKAEATVPGHRFPSTGEDRACLSWWPCLQPDGLCQGPS